MGDIKRRYIDISLITTGHSVFDVQVGIAIVRMPDCQKQRGR